MTLQNFESCLDKTILQRGRDYYKSGNIFSLEHNGDEWVAEVEGSEDYTVSVTLSDNGEIVDSSCDCPYDWGVYCKHQAAVFYALNNIPPSENIPTKRKEKLEEVLKKLDKQELLSVLLELADRDKRIKEELSLRYANETDMLEHARNVIKSTIVSVTRRGFVEYGDVKRAINGAVTVLDMTDSRIDSGDIIFALSLCTIVLEEMMDLLDCCDDSNGYVGGVICGAIEKVSEAIEAMPSGQEDEIFVLVFNHALNPMYDGWTHWRQDLLSAALPLCSNSSSREKLEQYLSAEYKNVKTKDRHADYESNELLKFHAAIIKRLDGDAAAIAFMEKHIGSFRRTLIHTAIDNREFEKALKLCMDGEWEDEPDARKWKNLRFTIYEKTGDKDSQKMLGWELLVEGDIDYYVKLKELHTKTEWSGVIHAVLERLAIQDRRGVYVKILEREKMKPQLFEYCKQNPHQLTSYYELLLPEYAKEVGEMLLTSIHKLASRAGCRASYRDVCGYIKKYEKAVGRGTAAAVRDELAAKYARRPAFLDELGK